MPQWVEQWKQAPFRAKPVVFTPTLDPLGVPSLPQYLTKQVLLCHPEGQFRRSQSTSTSLAAVFRRCPRCSTADSLRLLGWESHAR